MTATMGESASGRAVAVLRGLVDLDRKRLGRLSAPPTRCVYARWRRPPLGVVRGRSGRALLGSRCEHRQSCVFTGPDSARILEKRCGSERAVVVDSPGAFGQGVSSCSVLNAPHL